MSARGGFSPQRNDFLIHASIFCASLSFCGSALIVASYLRYPQMRKRAYELVTWLAIADLLANVSYFMGNPYDSNALCKSQAVIQQFFQVALIQWTVVIAAAMRGVTMAMKVYRSESQRMWKYHVYVWGIAVVLTVLPATTGSYGRSGAWCWIKSDGTFDNAGTWWRLFAFYIPLWIAMFYVVYTYFMIIRSLARHIHTQESIGGPSHSRHHGMSGDSAAAVGVGDGNGGICAVTPSTPRRARRKMLAAIQMAPDAFGKAARRASVSIGSWAGINASETLQTSDPNRHNNGTIDGGIAALEHLPIMGEPSEEEEEKVAADFSEKPVLAAPRLESSPGGAGKPEGFAVRAAEAGLPIAAPTAAVALTAGPPRALVSGVSGISTKDRGRSASYATPARRSSGVPSHHTRRSSTASSEGMAGVAKFIQRVKWYPVIFVFCWIFASINRIQNMVNYNNPIFTLYLLQVITVRIQGFLNALAYGFNGGVGDVWRGDPHVVSALGWLRKVFCCCCRRDARGDSTPNIGKAAMHLSADGGRRAATQPRAPIGGAMGGGESEEDTKNGKGDLESAGNDAIETTSASPVR